MFFLLGKQFYNLFNNVNHILNILFYALAILFTTIALYMSFGEGYTFLWIEKEYLVIEFIIISLVVASHYFKGYLKTNEEFLFLVPLLLYKNITIPAFIFVAFSYLLLKLTRNKAITLESLYSLVMLFVLYVLSLENSLPLNWLLIIFLLTSLVLSLRLKSFLMFKFALSILIVCLNLYNIIIGYFIIALYFLLSIQHEKIEHIKDKVLNCKYAYRFKSLFLISNVLSVTNNEKFIINTNTQELVLDSNEATKSNLDRILVSLLLGTLMIYMFLFKEMVP